VLLLSRKRMNVEYGLMCDIRQRVVLESTFRELDVDFDGEVYDGGARKRKRAAARMSKLGGQVDDEEDGTNVEDYCHYDENDDGEWGVDDEEEEEGGGEEEDWCGDETDGDDEGGVSDEDVGLGRQIPAAAHACSSTTEEAGVLIWNDIPKDSKTQHVQKVAKRWISV